MILVNVGNVLFRTQLSMFSSISHLCKIQCCHLANENQTHHITVLILRNIQQQTNVSLTLGH